MLSNVDIKRALGKRIGIYPFNGENLEGSSIYLTASDLAWSINSKKKAIDSEGCIIIEPHDTVAIITVESVCLGSNYAGYMRIYSPFWNKKRIAQTVTIAIMLVILIVLGIVIFNLHNENGRTIVSASFGTILTYLLMFRTWCCDRTFWRILHRPCAYTCDAIC